MKDLEIGNKIFRFIYFCDLCDSEVFVVNFLFKYICRLFYVIENFKFLEKKNVNGFGIYI